MTERVGNEASEAWRNHVPGKGGLLKPIVIRSSISSKPATRSTDAGRHRTIDLLDFDVAVTLHRDKSSPSGLGSVFQGPISAESTCGLPEHFGVLTLKRFLSKLEVVEIALPVFRFSGFVHQVQIAEALIAVHAWIWRRAKLSPQVAFNFGIGANN